MKFHLGKQFPFSLILFLFLLTNFTDGAVEGDHCENHADCDNAKTYLECDYQTKTCQCHEPDAWYDPMLQACVLLENAPCNPDPGIPLKQKCGTNSKCVNTTSSSNGVCKCEGDLKPNRNRQCFLEAGQICNSRIDQCDRTEGQWCDFMTLKCTCVQQYVDIEPLILEPGGKCRIPANHKCAVYYGGPHCTTNSKCVPVLGSGEECLCNEGLSPNSIGKCVLTYGAPCGYDHVGSCDAEGFQFCQPMEGRCLCQDQNTMIYSNAQRVCHHRLGHNCFPDSPIKCPPNSNCTGGSCRCEDGFVQVGNACLPPIPPPTSNLNGLPEIEWI